MEAYTQWQAALQLKALLHWASEQLWSIGLQTHFMTCVGTYTNIAQISPQ